MAPWLRTHLPMQETRVRYLVWEDPLGKEIATQSNILAWEIHEQRSLAGSSPWGHRRVRQDLATEQQQQNLYIRCVDVDVSLDVQVEVCIGCKVCEFGTERDLEWRRRFRSH